MPTTNIHYFPVFSPTDKAQNRSKKLLEDKNVLLVDSPEKADYILVGGGDGFMLDAIKKYMSYNKPFFGVNCGTLGFLLNPVATPARLPRKKSEISTVRPSTINVTLDDEYGKTFETICINDIMIGGNILDYYTFNISSAKWKQTIKGSGFVVSTSIGSTAYRLNLGGPLFPLHSKLWGTIGVASRPFQFKIMKPQKMTIKITGRRPTLIGVDGYANSYKHIVKVTCAPSKQHVTLGFFKGSDFETKRLSIAEQKLYVS